MTEREYRAKRAMLNHYKKNAEAWKDAYDDRRIYSNTYYMLVEAVEEMKQIENQYILYAFYKQFTKDKSMLDDIEKRFQGR